MLVVVQLAVVQGDERPSVPSGSRSDEVAASRRDVRRVVVYPVEGALRLVSDGIHNRPVGVDSERRLTCYLPALNFPVYRRYQVKVLPSRAGAVGQHGPGNLEQRRVGLRVPGEALELLRIRL